MESKGLAGKSYQKCEAGANPKVMVWISTFYPVSIPISGDISIFLSGLLNIEVLLRHPGRGQRQIILMRNDFAIANCSDHINGDLGFGSRDTVTVPLLWLSLIHLGLLHFNAGQWYIYADGGSLSRFAAYITGTFQKLCAFAYTK